MKCRSPKVVTRRRLVIAILILCTATSVIGIPFHTLYGIPNIQNVYAAGIGLDKTCTAANGFTSSNSCNLSSPTSNVLIIMVIDHGPAGSSTTHRATIGGTAATNLTNKTGGADSVDVWYLFAASPANPTSCSATYPANDRSTVTCESYTGTATSSPFFEDTATNSEGYLTNSPAKVTVNIAAGTTGRWEWQVASCYGTTATPQIVSSQTKINYINGTGNLYGTLISYQTSPGPDTLTASCTLSGGSLRWVTVATAILPSQYTSTQTTTIGNATLLKPCSIQVFLNGGYTTMQDCSTGAILFYSTSAYAVISDAIGNATGSSVVIKAGTYVISNQITPTVNNVTLYGEGWGKTVLKAGTNIVNTSGLVLGNDGILALYNVSGWTVKDIEFNGNSVNQSGGGSTPSIDCMDAESVTGLVIEHIFTHDCKTYGIHVGSYGYSEVLDSYTLNTGANGITLYSYVSNHSVVGNDIVSRNIVVGASDVGITLEAVVHTIVSENTVSNINQNISPYGQNSHIGIDVGDVHNSSYTQVIGNQVTNCAAIGITSSPTAGTTNYEVGIIGNTMENDGTAIYLTNTQGATVSGDVIQSSTVDGIRLYTGATDVVISGNRINDTASYGIYSQGGIATITGNSVSLTSDAAVNTAAIMVAANNNVVSNNIVDTSDTTVSVRGIWIGSSNTGVTVMGNTVQGYVGSLQNYGIYLSSQYSSVIGNTIGGYSVCIFTSGSTAGDIVSQNRLSPSECGSGMTGKITFTGSESIIGNYGYNPRGTLTDPWDGTDKWVSDSSGGSSAPTNSTVYTVVQSPKIIMVLIASSYGTCTLTIQIDGITILNGVTPPTYSLYTFTLNPGETFYIIYHSSSTSFLVSGE